MSDRAKFTSAEEALNFIMSGSAVFTIVSKKTGSRFTYQVKRPKDKPGMKGRPDIGFRWVKLLIGPDNTRDYQYMGRIRGLNYEHGLTSDIPSNAASVVGLNWVLRWLVAGNLKEDKIEIWHEGRCGKCAKRLTVPSSIANGLGPECIKTVYRCV